MNSLPRAGLQSPSAFTLIELLVVIAIIGALAALIVGGAGHARETSVRSRVQTELNQLVGAIESYHKKYGFYPPDNPKDVTLSPLYYELTGNGADASVASFFGVKGIVNEVSKGGQNFFPNLGAAGKAYKVLANPANAYALVVSCKGPTDYNGPQGELNTWRYRSTNPTNNTETFDLWAAAVVGNKTILIPNWKE